MDDGDTEESGSHEPGFFQGFLDFVNTTIFHTDTTTLQKNMFRVHIRDISIQRARSLLYGIAFLVGVFWPMDYVILDRADGIRVFSIWRTLTILLLGGGISLVDVFDSLRSRWFNTYLLSSLLVYLPISGYLFGSVYGLDFPWFYLVFLIPLFIVMLAFDFTERLFACSFLTGSFLFGYLYAQPEPLGFRYISHVFTLGSSAVVLGVLIGHTIYHLDFVNFFQQRLVGASRQKIQHMAEHDQLTGLYNRRQFDQEIREEFQRCERYDRKFSLLMIDLDHFKNINDTYGHTAGDDVLRAMGELIQNTSRRPDVTGRYGGEEFCIALPETSLDSAVIRAERLQEELSQKTFEDPKGEQFTVTCSIGATEYTGEAEEARDLLNQADEALYEAKEKGRDRVVRT